MLNYNNNGELRHEFLFHLRHNKITNIIKGSCVEIFPNNVEKKQKFVGALTPDKVLFTVYAADNVKSMVSYYTISKGDACRETDYTISISDRYFDGYYQNTNDETGKIRRVRCKLYHVSRKKLSKKAYQKQIERVTRP